MRLLLIEDDEVLAKVLLESLIHQRYVVDAVEDGQMGWEYAQSANYDLILMDVGLPRLDGRRFQVTCHWAIAAHPTDGHCNRYIKRRKPMSPSQAPQGSGNNPYVIGHPVEPSPRWVRVKFGGEIVADSTRVLLLRQYGLGRLPTYYFPQADVRMDMLEPATHDQHLGEAMYWTVKVGNRVAENAAWTLLNPPPDLTALKGYITFEWNKMDTWYEEEEEVFVHARDPHKRVDVLASSRHVRVVIAGETVAETRCPYLLFESSLPTRYYIPRADVRMGVLEPTSLITRCPYKGIASHWWSVKIGDHVEKNVVWSYPDPIPECPKIKDLLCFFNERVDVYVDGELQARPQTPWS